jgi:hypothetical protein
MERPSLEDWPDTGVHVATPWRAQSHGISARSPQPVPVRVLRGGSPRAREQTGAPASITASGWYARILQHEIDCLRGIVCCDRMDPRTLATQDNYMRHWQSMSLSEARATFGPMPTAD